ncbi:MAG TPA: hypothetical protein VM264_07130 [Acidimicrobiales bacterium]|nr:hypothetical protein [Acidimicrobiales bacterium]
MKTAEVTELRTAPAPPALDRAQQVAGGLPVMRSGVATASSMTRLWAAVWALAAQRGIALRSEGSLADAARLLVGHGAIIPPAGDALVDLDRARARAEDDAAVAAVAERLAGYLELRARYG